MDIAKPLDPRRDIRITARLGLGALAVFIGTAGVWATTAPLSGAVIAPGQVVVESNVRRIQHPTGGVVAEIFVDDGDRVKAGQRLVRFDETTARANLGVIDVQVQQLEARKARLETERDGRDKVTLPEKLAARSGEPEIVSAIRGELNLFASRRRALDGQIAQLRERIAQTGEEIAGLAAQIESKKEQLRLIRQELSGVFTLYESGLAPLSRLAALQREAASLSGEQGQLVAQTARARGSIAEIELQIIQLDQNRSQEVATELRDVEAKIADLAERRIAAIDQLQRTEIRAPQDGIVHQKAVHTIGGVVGPGEQMMLLIPEQDGLVVDARIDPQMIDRIGPGQHVLLRFPAFDAATTPDLAGELLRISPDLTRDQQTGASFYVARVALAPGEGRKLEGKTLVPGMPVETYIQTGERTALAYLLKPLEDQLARAFRYD
ncbi:HlyD family type I secretion periplasmic adaptor subunit [Prosthecomicrobium pneumaticum]|uniref:Membrane fusion protein (MFP) family protein n=1 Tax=Prosthecomicrobium pneumaticum TaxID=81895 RepID=A0A7W9FKR1_9HYPH|nr:HlyD family type I secretion periplasmic adaptor subunit [Prosthecomicrobium pneumaticum]MBB5751154.1 HlyD family secretion protein [Prosthecomicrobium pneumaticum]